MVTVGVGVAVVLVAVEVEVADEVSVADALVIAGVELVTAKHSVVDSTILVLNGDVGSAVGSTRQTRWYSEYHSASSYI
jgi:hypothetical protein